MFRLEGMHFHGIGLLFGRRQLTGKGVIGLKQLVIGLFEALVEEYQVVWVGTIQIAEAMLCRQLEDHVINHHAFLCSPTLYMGGGCGKALFLSTTNERYKMKTGKKLVVLYTRINGVERLQVEPGLESRDGRNGQDGRNGRGMEINREFHKALGLKVGGVR